MAEKNLSHSIDAGQTNSGTVMKNKFKLLLSLLVVVAVQSCTKMQNQNLTVTQTVSAKISANETYTFTLPANVSSHDFQITAPGIHAASSSIQQDANGNLTFVYTPVKDYSGADQMILTTIPDSTDTHSSNCSGHHDAEHADGVNDADNDNHHREHHVGEHHREHGDHDAEKNMVITINLTIDPVASATSSSEKTRH